MLPINQYETAASTLRKSTLVGFRGVITLAVFIWPKVGIANDHVPGYVDRLEVRSSYDAYGGASFGNVGPYTAIVGIVHEKIDPDDAANAGIVDLKLAPRDTHGLVAYSEDFVILRPKSTAKAKRVLFYDVVNRGGKTATGFFNNGGRSFAPGQQGDALLLRLGYTLVWSGWQGNVLQTGQGDTAVIGTDFPIASNGDGSPITGQTREEYILDALDASSGPGLNPSGVATVTLTYPAATLDPTGVTFNWRQTWLRSPLGAQDYDSPSASVPVSNWSYVNDGSQVQFTPPTGSDLGSIFTFIYTAKNPKINGLGFAGVREFVAFLNHDSMDHQGNPNPLSDFRSAHCERHCERDSNFEVTLMEGVSQSGRFARDFLWQGFNDDARGTDDRRAHHLGRQSHTVFNGMYSIIPGSRKTYTNSRWSQPFRWSRQHEDHYSPGDQFPFAYQVTTDPVSGETDGILRRCQETDTCPKIIHLIGGFETWEGRDSLVSTDGLGNDIRLPENVREYVVPGANHGGGGGVAAPFQPSQCKYPSSAVREVPLVRAFAPVIEAWVTSNVPPPPSDYPSNAANTLAPPEDQTAVGFPDLRALGVSYPGNLYNQLVVTAYSNGIPSPRLSSSYPVLVSKTNADGNELSGIRVPEVAVPLATYTSWNLRTAAHASDDGCYLFGSTIAFASTKTQRIASGDPRPSLEERYSSKADYVNKVRVAAEALVAKRLLLPEDVRVYVSAAEAQTVLP